MSSLGHKFNHLGICLNCRQITGREHEICSSVHREHLAIVAANVARNWFTIAPAYRRKKRLGDEILAALESHRFGDGLSEIQGMKLDEFYAQVCLMLKRGVDPQRLYEELACAIRDMGAA